MEFININNERLKIILSKEDMISFDIRPEEFDYSNTGSKHILWSVLNKAKKEAGFNADDTKLYVQLFTSGDGGCEIYISKIKNENKKEYQTLEESLSGIYIVLEFKALLDLCKRLYIDGYGKNGMLYYDRTGKYIFVPTSIKRMPSYIKNNENIITVPEYCTEYGSLIPLQEFTIDYFNEHFIKIAEGNIPEILTSYSSKI